MIIRERTAILYLKAIRKNVFGRTQAEVKEKLKRAIRECAEIDIERFEEYTVGGWVRTWYETYSKPHIRESTQEFYEDYIEHHIVSGIGNIKLAKLTGRDIQKLYNDVKANGRIRKKADGDTSMSASYVRGPHMMLHNCPDWAVRERLIARNPTEDCIVPKLEKKEIHNKILKSAGLPHIRLHDLRHTFATLALQNGVDVKTVSSILGHYDTGFTLRTYTHVTTKMQEEAATMGKLIGANVGEKTVENAE